MADQLPELYRRAAAGEPDMLRRIGFLVAAGAWPEAEAMLGAAGATIIATVGAAPVLRLIEKFPVEARQSSPNLLHMRCLTAWNRWDWPTMRSSGAQARLAFERAGEPRLAWRSGVYESIALVVSGAHEEARQRLAADPTIAVTRDDLALAAVVHSYLALDSGRLDAVAPRYREVLEMLEASSDPVLWYQCVPRSLQCGLPAMREPSRRFAVGALAVAPEAPTPLRAIALASSAWSDVWCGRLEPALKTAALAEADARWLGPPPNVRLALYNLLAVLFTLQGRRQDSYDAIDEILKLFDDPGGGYRRDSPLCAFYRLFAIRLADLHDDGERVRRLGTELLAEAEPAGAVLRPVLQAQRRVLRARLAWHDGDWHAVRATLRDALVDDQALALFGESVEIRLRLAQACLHLQSPDEAAEAIAPVFAGAERDGCPGGALTFGKRRLAALAAAPWRGRLAAGQLAVLDEWASRLADEAPPAPARPGEGEPGRNAPLVGAESLSPRELDVLRLIAAGDSNKLIARAFDLSPHTVKRHVANILDKLGVQSRGQAAAWYRARLAT